MKKQKLQSLSEALATAVHDEEFLVEYVNQALKSDLTADQQLVVISDLIEAMFISKKTNKAQLAKSIGITRDALYKIGKHKNPTLEVFLKLIKMLGLNVHLVPQKKKSATKKAA